MVHFFIEFLPSIVNTLTDKVALLTQNMKKLPSELVTSPDITDLENLSIEWDKRMTQSKSIGDVNSLLKNHSYFQEAQTQRTKFSFTLGLLLDVHIGVIWKVSTHLPVPAICSSGQFAEYSVISFQVFIFLVAFTGSTGLYLFIYRMRVATQHLEVVQFRKLSHGLYYFFLCEHLYCSRAHYFDLP
ncbi:hypothetical protein CRE_09105 [Caenorhabditis remanei]|uniref:Uncharacterized protein n=1 Tax=Caenorhabditis remanei TaxID=31234 RepID=E3LJA8_CAERE|nr:hypothetical protein CRE_09105 [Caenorhabditis remanei]